MDKLILKGNSNDHILKQALFSIACPYQDIPTQWKQSKGYSFSMEYRHIYWQLRKIYYVYDIILTKDRPNVITGKLIKKHPIIKFIYEGHFCYPCINPGHRLGPYTSLFLKTDNPKKNKGEELQDKKVAMSSHLPTAWITFNIIYH